MRIFLCTVLQQGSRLRNYTLYKLKYIPKSQKITMTPAADYRHLTEELEQTGKISQFITVDPEEQALERKCKHNT